MRVRPAVRGRRPLGFTLIELMIVVAIIGILAVLAAYGVRKYITNTKTAEARNALGRMSNAVAIEYENESMPGSMLAAGTSAALSRSLCASASATVPGNISYVQGKKYQSTTNDWNVDSLGNSGFACLHFTIDQPQYYLYTYTAQGSSNPGDNFTAMANGDLNGDGVLSTFSLVGSINSSFVINIAPNMLVINPDE